MGIETSRTTRGARTTREGVAVRAVRARDGFERRGDARKSDDADGRPTRRRMCDEKVARVDDCDEKLSRRLARRRLAVRITATSRATFRSGVAGPENFQTRATTPSIARDADVCLFIFFMEQCIGCRYAFKR